MAETSTWAKRWDHKLDVSDVFHNDDLTISEKAQKIAARIKAARFYDGDDLDLYYLVDELESVIDADHFDDVWGCFYDWCDRGKYVWVETWAKP